MAETGLKLECTAIGSLPHKDLDKAMKLVKEKFDKIPFCPQLTRLNKNEDMIIQFTENMPSFFCDEESGKIYLETESDKFFEDIETFMTDYEEIVIDINSELIEKYGLNCEYSTAYESFLEFIKETKPAFAKSSITGPFTLSTSLLDKYGRCAIYDETLREIIVKTLSLKALWQIKQIKKASPDTKPIIFIDEPSMSQLGTSAFITISQVLVYNMFREISDIIKTHGGMSGIHCCGKCDWTVPLNTGIDIINLDAYSYSQNLSLFNKDLEKFLKAGKKIAWGVVPTLDKEALEKADVDKLIVVFDKAVKYLTRKGINEKIIIENSIITPSCGAGALTEELAEKAMSLTRELSDRLKSRYNN